MCHFFLPGLAFVYCSSVAGNTVPLELRGLNYPDTQKNVLFQALRRVNPVIRRLWFRTKRPPKTRYKPKPLLGLIW